MIVVTGAAGFIGSCIVWALNKRGREDLILVDHLDVSEKKRNIEGKKYAQYFDKKEFLQIVKDDAYDGNISAVIHMGACSSTTLQDKQYFEENNYQYSRTLAQWALKKKVRFIYASSAATYGDGSNGYSDADEVTQKCKPLNLYGESKQKFDVWILEQGLINSVAGLKFFNVFGPNEYHKGDMRSVVAKAYQGVVENGTMRLFRSYRDEYADGEQKRDFIYVKDAVDVVLFFLDHPGVNGIYNVGTGKASSWNELADALFKAVGRPVNIEYVDMPEAIKSRYQYFTEADMSKLKNAGYHAPFSSLDNAVKDYVRYLEDKQCL